MLLARRARSARLRKLTSTGVAYLILDLQDPDRQRKAMACLEGLGSIRVLNVAGPRESEALGIYEEAKIFLRALFR